MNSFQPTKIPGCYRFRVNPRFQDARGTFVKPLHLNELKKNGVEFECRESFVSFSHYNVLRGMHFQTPPHAHSKIVTCLDGEIFDVIVDLRKDSKTYLQTEAFQLSGENGDCLFIPTGCAHGFQVMSKTGAWVAYYTSAEHHAESDRGVLWSSIKIEWPLKDPIVSPRDSQLPALDTAIKSLDWS